MADQLPSQLSDRNRSIVFLVLGVAASAGVIVLVGGIIGYAIAGAVGAGLAWLYRVTTPGPRRGDKGVRAGETACPVCASLQTDVVPLYDASGAEREHWHCFACDADWPLDE